MPIVTLNLFQGPWSDINRARAADGAPWMRNQVQHDGEGGGSSSFNVGKSLSPQPDAAPTAPRPVQPHLLDVPHGTPRTNTSRHAPLSPLRDRNSGNSSHL